MEIFRFGDIIPRGRKAEKSSPRNRRHWFGSPVRTSYRDRASGVSAVDGAVLPWSSINTASPASSNGHAADTPAGPLPMMITSGDKLLSLIV